MLDLETQRMTQYLVEKVEESDGQLSLKEIDVSAMGKALDGLSLAQRLGVPAYLTANLEVRGENTSRTAPKANGGLISSKETPLGKESESASKPEEAATNNDKHAAGGDDDDLDAWLDSVIT